jgi:hypothetical protein
LFQRASFRFIWNSSFEPISRKTLYLPFKNGGLNIPNIKLRWYSLLLKHLQDIISNHSSPWFYFAKYWIGFQLRHHNETLQENNFPHSEFVPPFYKQCLSAFKVLIDKIPDYKFVGSPSKIFYIYLLDTDYKVKCVNLFPQINFKNVFLNIFSSAIDPIHKNICYRLVHDVVYVDYFLYCKRISKKKSCYFCNGIETVSHLFIECSYYKPFNSIIIYLLHIISDKKIKFSEKVFRFFDLPKVSNDIKYTCLVILSLSRYLIWSSRLNAKHHNKKISIRSLLEQFFIYLRNRIYLDYKRLNSLNFLNVWAQHGFVTLNSNDISFNAMSFIDFYVNKLNLNV